MHPVTGNERKTQLRLMERSGYLPILRSLAKLSTAPFWWFVDDTPSSPAEIQHNGTVCFLKIGKRILGVTADHVYRGYIADLASRPVVCQIGSVRYQPEKRVISRDVETDLVTFDVPEFIVAAAGCSPHDVFQWPPPPLSEGELVIAGGFPGPLREGRLTVAEFPFITLASRVRQSGEDHASLQLELASSEWGTAERLYAGADLGGMSGGPVFRHHGEGIERISLAGFVYEYGPSWEIMLARHAASIAPDGTVFRPSNT